MFRQKIPEIKHHFPVIIIIPILHTIAIIISLLGNQVKFLINLNPFVSNATFLYPLKMMFYYNTTLSKFEMWGTII